MRQVASAVRAVLSAHGVSAQIRGFTDSAALCAGRLPFDLVFLAVELQPYNGIEAARKLQAINKSILIFFITSAERYLDDAMDLNAFRFIRKPVDPRRLRRGVEKALRLMESTRISFFDRARNCTLTVASDEVVYVEIIGRHTKLVLASETFSTTYPIDYWAQTLTAPCFFHVHKSFIINMNYITDYHHDFVMLSRQYYIPIAQRLRPAFRDRFVLFQADHTNLR